MSSGDPVVGSDFAGGAFQPVGFAGQREEGQLGQSGRQMRREVEFGGRRFGPWRFGWARRRVRAWGGLGRFGAFGALGFFGTSVIPKIRDRSR